MTLVMLLRVAMLAFVCHACRNAAASAAVEPSANPGNARVRARNIKALHAVCRGGTWCDCQHKVT